MCWSHGGKKPFRNPGDPDPTAEQVEAIVAEQMRCLPDWWWSERAFGYGDR